MSDDDLPVLTHVLRTGARSVPLAANARFDAAFHDHFDVVPADEPPIPAIVIGYAPVMPIVPVRDAFRLVQDSDPLHVIPESPITEPHIVTVTDPTAVDPVLDTPLDFSRPPTFTAWAAHVREAVMDDLSTRIDTELDARIAQTMHVEVETAIAQLQAHLRTHLTDALRDVVARAVDDAIARIEPPHTNGDKS